MCTYQIGVDEAGRGPLAGPVSVGVACVPTDFNWDQIPGVNDSKKLTEAKREEIFAITQKLVEQGKLEIAVEMVSAKEIDAIRIVAAVTKAMQNALSNISADPQTVTVKLDGGLTAPAEYLHQETIIKGDSKEKVIGLASIMAKVTRDRYMVQIAKKPLFATYNFDIHKGYGTKKHRESIAQHGLSTEHRKTYCKNIILL